MMAKHLDARRAFTYIELMIAAIVLSIAIIGTSVYQYESALNIRKADAYSTAVRTASLLCVGWTGVDGGASFNPVSTYSPDVNIIAGTGPEGPPGFNLLGSYTIVIDDSYYFATLSWKDVSTEVRTLHVIVNWDRKCRGTNQLEDADGSYRLTTYVQK